MQGKVLCVRVPSPTCSLACASAGLQIRLCECLLGATTPLPLLPPWPLCASACRRAGQYRLTSRPTRSQGPRPTAPRGLRGPTPPLLSAVRPPVDPWPGQLGPWPPVTRCAVLCCPHGSFCSILRSHRGLVRSADAVEAPPALAGPSGALWLGVSAFLEIVNGFMKRGECSEGLTSERVGCSGVQQEPVLPGRSAAATEISRLRRPRAGPGAEGNNWTYHHCQLVGKVG